MNTDAENTARTERTAAPLSQAEAYSPLWQAGQLMLWLAASSTALPDTALDGLGLDSATRASLLEPLRADLAAMRAMLAATRLLPRRATAELLRCRVNVMALTARSPAELAAVARTVRSLPDWVWEDALLHDNGGPVPISGGKAEPAAAGRTGSPADRAARPSGTVSRSASNAQGAPAAPASARQGSPAQPVDSGAAPGSLLATDALPQDWQLAMPSTALVDSLPLNRQQRRSLEARLRKLR